MGALASRCPAVRLPTHGGTRPTSPPKPGRLPTPRYCAHHALTPRHPQGAAGWSHCPQVGPELCPTRRASRNLELMRLLVPAATAALIATAAVSAMAAAPIAETRTAGAAPVAAPTTPPVATPPARPAQPSRPQPTTWPTSDGGSLGAVTGGPGRWLWSGWLCWPRWWRRYWWGCWRGYWCGTCRPGFGDGRGGHGRDGRCCDEGGRGRGYQEPHELKVPARTAGWAEFRANLWTMGPTGSPLWMARRQGVVSAVSWGRKTTRFWRRGGSCAAMCRKMFRFWRRGGSCAAMCRKTS